MVSTLDPPPRKLRIDLSTLNAFANHQLPDEIDSQIANYLSRHGELVDRLPQSLQENVFKRLQVAESQRQQADSKGHTAKYRVRSRTVASHRSQRSTATSPAEAVMDPHTEISPPGANAGSDSVISPINMVTGESARADAFGIELFPQQFSFRDAPRTSQTKRKKKSVGFFANAMAHLIPPMVTLAFGYYWLGNHFTETGHLSTIIVEKIPDGCDVYVDDEQLQVDRMSSPATAQASVAPGTHVVKLIRKNGSVTTRSVNIRKNELFSVEIDANESILNL
ncbi:MAG: hypothetical protein ABL921_21105 [Pirellula sp.]